ncbi:MAG: hypothetical protein RIM99_16320 [Cyclobacteriaceae bacterium]
MNIEVKEMEDYDFLSVENLIEELYAELGEPTANIGRLRDGFMSQLVENNSCMVLLFKNFVSGELMTLATLTESNAVSGRKYGVLDEVFTRNKFRYGKRESELKNVIKGIALRKNWSRIDFAAPTDAWYRTIRFRNNQKLRLTAPKFKHVIKGIEMV